MYKFILTFFLAGTLFLSNGYSQDITLTKSFEGIQWNAKLPPDPEIAVGPNHVVLTVNNKIEIYNKTGTKLSESTLLSWFSSKTPPGDPFDPKVVYDHLDNRWIVFALSRPSGEVFTPSNYLISVSQSSDPTGGWYYYKFDARMDNTTNTYNWADFSGLGYDQNAVYITSNQKLNYAQLDFQYAKIRAIKKSDLYSGLGNPTFHDFTNMYDASGNKSENIKPVHQFGTSSEYYLVNTANNATANYVTVWAITNPFGSSPTITRRATINVGNYNPPGTDTPPGDAVQKNSTTKIDLSDARISDCIYKDGFLYGCFAVKNSTNDGSAIKYFKINTSDFSLAFNGVIELSGLWYYYPEIYPDNYGNVLITFSKSSTNDFAGLAYTYRKAEQTTIGPINWLKQGEGTYNNLNSSRNRWGDYNGICLDPSQGNQIWLYGEYAKSNNTWGTWVGAIQFNLSTVPITFTNKISTQNAGGSFSVTGYGNVNSGNSLQLLQGNYTTLTNNERFSNWNSTGINYKHNNWNDIGTEYFLSRNFIATFGPEQNQKANFNSLNYAKAQVLIEGSLIQNLGNIDFQDPWYVQSNGSQQGFNYWLPVISSYEPTGKYGATDKGVFLGQNPNPNNPNVPYYSVQALLTQPITVNGQTYTGIFQNWSTTNASLQPPISGNPSGYDQKVVVFNNANATVTANYKGIHLSNDANAFSNNSQRKLIETKTGTTTWLHQVYTSVGHVWIEHSSNGGSIWILGNNGQPLDGTVGGKNPSIAFTTNSDYNYIGVVWQQPYNSTYVIRGMMFNQYAGSSNVPSPVTEVRTLHTEPSDAYSVNANPNLVLGGGAQGPYLITLERKSASGGWQPGINWLVGNITDSGTAWDGPFGNVESNGIVSGTNAGTINVQMSAYPSSTVIELNLIRQQGSPGIIYSNYLYLTKANGYWEYFQTDDGIISYSADVNSSPSIVTLPDYIYAACWVEYEQMVYYSLNYKVRYYYGLRVQSCSINRGGGSSNSGFAAWSQGPSSWSNKSIRFDIGSPVSSSISTLSTSGKYLQAGNGAGSDLSNMYVSSFYPFSSPYYFGTSGTLGPLSKANPELVTGRGFEIKNGDATFGYRFEDLNVDGKNIGFIDAPDTADYGKIEVLNNALVTEPFQINADSKVVFTEQSGFADSIATVKMLGKDGYINYKVELIDNATGKVIGTVKNVNLKSLNAHALKISSYSLNTGGLAGKTLRIKITLEPNFVSIKNSSDEALTQFLQNDKIPIDIRNARKNARHSNLILIKSLTEKNETLAKSSFEQIALDELNIPTSYALEQNYPNPFNPSTTISYTLPEDGKVLIKIFDVLGREVATLINGFSSSGKHNVVWDATRFASGIYFYRITFGNQTFYKKMLLMK